MINITLIGPTQREYAGKCIDQAEDGSVVKILKPTRSNQQNAKMWAMLADIRRSEPEGRKWTVEVWKCAFMHSLGWQVQFAQALDNSGPFPIGYRSSNLTVPQMSDLIMTIQEYGDRHGIRWTEKVNGGWNDRNERC